MDGWFTRRQGTGFPFGQKVMGQASERSSTLTLLKQLLILLLLSTRLFSTRLLEIERFVQFLGHFLHASNRSFMQPSQLCIAHLGSLSGMVVRRCATEVPEEGPHVCFGVPGEGVSAALSLPCSFQTSLACLRQHTPDQTPKQITQFSLCSHANARSNHRQQIF